MNYRLLIVYTTNRIAQIDEVQDYGLLDTGTMFFFIKNGVRNFVPARHVLYFGKAEDWYSV